MSILQDRCHCRLSAAHTLQAQLKAALATAELAEQELHAAQQAQHDAEQRAAETCGGGPRYVRNPPDLWPVIDWRTAPLKG